MLEPYEGRIYDPCCGSGGMLIAAKEYIDEHGENGRNANLFGQVRYNGDAGTLWRLTGISTFDLTGNVAIGADVSGR